MKTPFRLSRLAVLMLALLFTGCGSSSPSGVVKRTLLKANEGKYSEASEGLSSDMQKAFDSGHMKQVLRDSITKKGTIKDVEILKEEIRGEGAKVSFKITYNDGSTIESEESIVKENGKWRMSLLDTMNKVMYAAKPAPNTIKLP